MALCLASSSQLVVHERLSLLDLDLALEERIVALASWLWDQPWLERTDVVSLELFSFVLLLASTFCCCGPKLYR